MGRTLDRPITMVSRADARRRVNQLLLRRPLSKIVRSAPELAAFVRMRRTMVMSWARATYQEAGMDQRWKDVDKVLGQRAGTLALQGRTGAPWPTALAQSRSAELYGVSPIGIEPLEEARDEPR